MNEARKNEDDVTARDDYAGKKWKLPRAKHAKKLYVHASFRAKTKYKHFPTLLVSFLQD